MATPPPVNKTRLRSGRRESLHAILLMQNVLLKLITKKSADPVVVPRAALAWERLEDRKRIIRGRPLPGSLKPVTPNKRKEKYWMEPDKIITNETPHEAEQLDKRSGTSEAKGA